ncbi:hypothetical protein [Kribbella sp. NPDC051718]|uniref:hypothetical protein n=1 Tax=Kribbella sp. NPDC051718 TaxID=3155168 RepID=UPI003430D77E
MLKIVFATTTTTVSNGPGSHTVVHEGEHWWAGDPLVKAHPSLFTTDGRHGLCSSVTLPEDDDSAAPEPVIESEWLGLVASFKAAGLTPETAAALAEAANQTAGQAAADEVKTGGDASASQPTTQAPVEQATKAPGEKRTTRRG